MGMIKNAYKNGHSIISPSGASRWAKCAGSVRLTLNEPNQTNSMAERGTNIHQLGEMILGGSTFTVGEGVERDFNKGSFFAVEQDMLDEAQRYCDYVHNVAGSDGEIIAEAQVVCIPEHDVQGHIDATVVNGDTLHIIDLKTGRGAVSAEENLQLQLYALGAYEEHSLLNDIEHIELHIVQDNNMIHNTNSWALSVDDLMDFKEWITERARLALQDDSICTPSESACQWCSHASNCKALSDEVANAFDEIDESDVDTLSLERVTDLLSKEKLIAIAMKSYKTRVEDELRAGNEVQGFKMVATRKNKKWANETEAYNKLQSWFPKSEFEELLNVKLITPTQAIKLVASDLTPRKKKIFDELWEQPEGEPKLVEASAKGEPIIFGDDFDEL